MIRLLSWALRKAFEGSDDQEKLRETIRSLEEQLQQQKHENQEEASPQIQCTNGTIAETDCFKKTGTITRVEADFFVIDGLYPVPNTMLKSSGTSMLIQENMRVKYLAHRKTDTVTKEHMTKVIKIDTILDNLWTDEGETTDESAWMKSANEIEGTTYYNDHRRREPGKVIAKADNTITVETDAGEPISVNIDKTRMTFVPELGDYVVLDCVVQADQEFVDLKGEVLDVVGVEPTRVVIETGTVINIEPEGGEIRTDNVGTFIFQTEYLADYRPMKGDLVSFQAVENEFLRMRCISVKLVAAATIPRTAIPNDHGAKGTRSNTNGNENMPDLDKDKQGIRITGDFNVTLKDSQDTVVRTVTIRNESSRQHKLIRLVIQNDENNSCLCLMSPLLHTQTILFPGESVEYEFKITARGFFGRNNEPCIWFFGGPFRIRRWFHITVGDPVSDDKTGSTATGPYNAKISYCQRQLATLNMRRAASAAGNTFVPGRAVTKRMNFIANPLPMYNIPKELFDLVLTAATRSDLHGALERPPYRINEELSPHNYHSLMNTIIYLEEIKQNIDFRRHDIDRGHFTPEDSYLALEVPNIAEARPSILLGDTVNATAPWNKDDTTYQGVIHRVLHSRVLLKFDNAFHARYNGESYQLQFSFGRGMFRKQHHAIKRIQQTHGIDYLFPDCITLQKPLLDVRLNANGDLMHAGDNQDGDTGNGRVLPWVNTALNRYQRQAIVNVLRGEARPIPHIIFGPPGTGKTVTIIELIHQLVANVPSARIIVVTPSNSAAYLITERLARCGVLAAGDFIRLVSMSQVEREAIPEHLAQYCATVDVADEMSTNGQVLVTDSGLRMKFQAKHIGRHRVTIGTCLGVGSLMLMRFEPNHFTHIIIDEAGQAHEAEALIPIVQVARKIGSVTLVGDPKQLGPIFLFNDIVQWSHNLSLLERLLARRLYAVDRKRFEATAGYNPRLVTMLRTNYRSIPSVLQVYNNLYYDGCLEAHNSTVSVDDQELLGTIRSILGLPPASEQSRDYGFFFCGIDGTNKQSPDSPSWFNPAEACQVHRIVERLYRGGRYGPSDIGVVTPYVMQVRSIRRIFDAASLESPKIGSVEEFQGQERRVVIVSTVRSSTAHLSNDANVRLGFVSQPKRINVVLSRAKVALIIVGHPKLLVVDRTWMKLLQLSVDKGTYCGCTLSTSILNAASSENTVNGNDKLMMKDSQAK